MIYAMYFVGTIISVLSNALIKLFRKTVPDERTGDGLYYAVSIPVALFYFALVNGFDVRVNGITLAFSVIFSICCYLSVLFQMKASDNASLVHINLFSNAGTLLISSMTGLLFFNETVSLKQVIGLLLTLLSVVVPYLAAEKDRPSTKGVIFCLLLAVNGALVKIIMKSYYIYPGCMNENVFCFYANVFLVPFVLFMQRRAFFKEKILSKAFTTLRKPSAIAAFAVVCANIATWITMVFVGKVDLFVSSVITPPITICTVFLFDIFMFKEKVRLNNIISIILAIGAMILII